MKIYDHRVKRSWFKIATVDLLMEYIDGKALDELEMPERRPARADLLPRGLGPGPHAPPGRLPRRPEAGNIMLSKAGEVKIIDFGTAWIKGEEKNRIQGTPQYMAPEQATDKVVNEKTDIYNLGATMYRMFTGHYANAAGLPGSARTCSGTAASSASPIKIDPKIPGTLNEAIIACLQPNPDARPAGVFEVEHQLKAVAKYMGVKEDDLKGAEDEDEEEWQDDA